MEITTVDIFMAFLGLVGLTTVAIVMASAFSNTDRLERNRKVG